MVKEGFRRTKKIPLLLFTERRPQAGPGLDRPPVSPRGLATLPTADTSPPIGAASEVQRGFGSPFPTEARAGGDPGLCACLVNSLSPPLFAGSCLPGSLGGGLAMGVADKVAAGGGPLRVAWSPLDQGAGELSCWPVQVAEQRGRDPAWGPSVPSPTPRPVLPFLTCKNAK